MKMPLIGLLLLSVAVICGCQVPSNKVKTLVPGKDTLEEAVVALQGRTNALKPTEINGTCKLEYVDEDGNWRGGAMAFDMKLWLEPPYNLHMQISVTLGPQGMVFLGTNQEAFWLSIKPEVNTYWYGYWSDMPDVAEMELNPWVVSESLGVILFAQNETWELTNREGVDVLTCTESSSGQMTKRLYVDTRQYQPTKIEYFDTVGDVAVVARMGYYKVVDAQNLFPTRIYVTQHSDGQKIGQASFHLQDGRARRFQEKHRRRVFQLDEEPRGYDHVVDVSSLSSM